MLCIIDGRLLSGLDRWLLTAPDPGPGLLAHALDTARRLEAEAGLGEPLRLVLAVNPGAEGEKNADTDMDTDLARLACPGPEGPDEPRWVSLARGLVPALPGPARERVLLFCPGAGAVSPTLAARLLARLPGAGDAVLASADALHHNAHPGWVMLPEGRYDPEQASYEHDHSLRLLLEVAQRDGDAAGSRLRAESAVTGSHRLSELLVVTGGVVLAASRAALARAAAGEPPRPVDARGCPDVPAVYAQPFFALAPEPGPLPGVRP
ncbi:MAG: hypothetical protein AB7D57_03205 [Desulfovibrionaceae bacterium]